VFPPEITRRFPYVRSIKCNKQKDKDKYAAEKADIAEIFDRNKGIYGYRRITEQLKKKGYSINHKTVLKLIKSLNLRGKQSKNGKYHSYKGEVGKIADNILKRDFTAKKPFEKLTTEKLCLTLFHSAQGWQYQHAEYQRLLAEHNITQSMSRKGNCMDNGAMENFFGRLKVETFYGERFESVDDFILALDNYIHYYNNERISLKLKGMSPVQYRTHALAS